MVRSTSHTVTVNKYNYINCNEDGGCVTLTSTTPKPLTGNLFGNVESCQEKCKPAGFRCDQSKACIDYWSTLPPPFPDRNDITPTKEACQTACKKYYTCACDGECAAYYTTDTTPDPSLFTTKEECEKNPTCIQKACYAPFFSDRYNVSMFVCFMISLIFVLIAVPIILYFKFRSRFGYETIDIS